ncbi:YheC/YheD family protein [Alicyclobacillus ferrooxydans]|nr:YheC/YheD family protein [Alicyclobacillus ferrooxydans]
MSETLDAEVVWVRAGGRIRAVLYTTPRIKSNLGKGVQTVRFSNLRLPWLTTLPKGRMVYRHPTEITFERGEAVIGPVFAILAGTRHFTDSRADFRDVLETGRSQGAFIYVLPTECVRDGDVWSGYVRTGYQKWVPIPCPRPEAVYNRIPNRVLEVNRHAKHAKMTLRKYHTPMFNPGYFNKAETYDELRRAGLAGYLPQTLDEMTWKGFSSMLQQNGGVYLKPASSSVGHGIMRVDRTARGWRLRVLKHLKCSEYDAPSIAKAWELTKQHRIRGKYVIQQAIPLVEWEGKPCDVRVLLQKHGLNWQVVGKGVRVAGKNSITTHVPAGGSIVDIDHLLQRAFPDSATQVDARIEELALNCAAAIDRDFHGELGEMSMDVGVDKEGRVWLFEANSKPMKFDEPHIRERSLAGVILRLKELRRRREIR